MCLSFSSRGFGPPPSASTTSFSTSRWSRHLAASSASIGATGFGSSAILPFGLCLGPLIFTKRQRRQGASSPSRDSFHLVDGRHSHLGVVLGGVRCVRRGGAAFFASWTCGGPRRRRRFHRRREASLHRLSRRSDPPWRRSCLRLRCLLGHRAASIPTVPLVRLLLSRPSSRPSEASGATSAHADAKDLMALLILRDFLPPSGVARFLLWSPDSA